MFRFGTFGDIKTFICIHGAIKTKPKYLQSRIDFWFFLEDKIDSRIEASILTDHKGISLKVHINGIGSRKVSRGYWKLYKKLLENELCITEIRQIIGKYWTQACIMNNL